MAIHVRLLEEIAVLDVSGRMRIDREELELRERFARLIDSGHRRFLLNLTGVRFMDSAALGETVACQKRAQRLDGDVKLLVTSGGKPDQILKITKLDQAFDVFYDETEALTSFASPVLH